MALHDPGALGSAALRLCAALLNGLQAKGLITSEDAAAMVESALAMTHVDPEQSKLIDAVIEDFKRPFDR